MFWITFDEKYTDYLRKYEARIPMTDYGTDRMKPFFGVLFEVDDLSYVTQVSSVKQRHLRMPAQKDFKKIYYERRLISVVNLNYMFPIPTKMVNRLEMRNIDEYRTFSDDRQKSNYIRLLNTELRIINQMNISSDAEYIYRLKYDKPDDFISKRCFDFKTLEQLAYKYMDKTIEIHK